MAQTRFGPRNVPPSLANHHLIDSIPIRRLLGIEEGDLEAADVVVTEVLLVVEPLG